MTNEVIAVIGGTGAQGGGVVDALLATGRYQVRVASRSPGSPAAQALARRGVEVVAGDLLQAESLRPVFAGAYGAFIVTNFWDESQMHSEVAIGSAAVRAARAAGVHHLVWSTLPDAEALSGGRFKVVHFSGKAQVDAVVEAAGFPRHTFVQAPMYFQNLVSRAAPEALPNGGRGWAVPMDPAARVMHAGDVSEVGRAVAAALSAGERLPNGSTLAVCGGAYSWNDFVATLNGQGHRLQAIRVPAEVFDTFFPGAPELREMYQYYEEYTYFGPRHAERVAATRALVPEGFTSFADWAKVNMKPT